MSLNNIQFRFGPPNLPLLTFAKVTSPTFLLN
nr:MAG TPA_asm: hypothetical protein [Caudoviricetes sp.]